MAYYTGYVMGLREAKNIIDILAPFGSSITIDRIALIKALREASKGENADFSYLYKNTDGDYAYTVNNSLYHLDGVTQECAMRSAENAARNGDGKVILYRIENGNMIKLAKVR